MAPFYPGGDSVDVLATDTYGGHYEPEHYTALLDPGAGRPIGLGECGAPPDDVLAGQPRWAWFMGWPDQVTGENTPERIRAVYTHPRVVVLETPER